MLASRHLTKLCVTFMVAIVTLGCATMDNLRVKYYNEPGKMRDVPELRPLSRGLDTYLFKLKNTTNREPEFFVSDRGVIHIFQPTGSGFGHFQIGTAPGNFDRKIVGKSRGTLCCRDYTEYEYSPFRMTSTLSLADLTASMVCIETRPFVAITPLIRHFMHSMCTAKVNT